jgi:hypothetical protein
MVMRDDWRKDFPGRLVRRCDESPQEHAYGLDRFTRTGYAIGEYAYPHPKTK